MRKKIRLFFLILIAILPLGGLVVLYFLAQSVYDKSFNYRCTTDSEHSFELSEFEALTSKRYTFKSKQGQQLTGYLYENGNSDTDKKGVVVFAHGLGAGGQNGYMNIFDYLTRQGYYVFAYDATANDESEGDKIGGLPQGYIDLDYAIDFAYTIEEIQDIPFVLMGYSWGGLSVANVLNKHPEVEAVVSLAGWNKTLDMIEYRGYKKVGAFVKILVPFVSLYEYLTYGNYACMSGLKGFEKSDCRVMVVHGANDDTVPIEYGYDIYYEKYGQNDRFVFKKYEDRNHLIFNCADGTLDLDLMSEIVAFFDESLKIAE